MEAEPCLGYAFNISAPFRTAALMSVAGMSKGWGVEKRPLLMFCSFQKLLKGGIYQSPHLRGL